MWRFGLRQGAQLALGLAGAILLAAMVAAADDARAGAGAFLHALLAHLGSFLHLDFGTSTISGESALAELSARLPVTLELAGLGGIVALLIGAPLGILLGTERPLRAGAPLIQIVAAIPVFCVGLALMWLAANVLHWPEHGASQFARILQTLALPALTVGAAGAAIVQLSLRRAAAEAMDEPYRRGLRLMGLSAFDINTVFLVPQILAGLLRSLGEITLALFSAAAVAEWLFGWPGAAVLFLKSVALHDWNVAALVLLVFAAIKMIADFAGIVGARALSIQEPRA
ncbi:MAG TPA: ABC transporter permease [Rhizomicrobium sp.]|nr:ABC transporter permease [Rhizomicrobium sp.]